MGAVQNEAKRSRPEGTFAGSAWLPDTDSMWRRVSGLAKSAGAHSAHAEPVARMPSGVRIMRTARAIQSGLVASQEWTEVLLAPGAVAMSSEGSARCRYETTPAVTTISASPATVRWPIIIAGIAMCRGYGA